MFLFYVLLVILLVFGFFVYWFVNLREIYTFQQWIRITTVIVAGLIFFFFIIYCNPILTGVIIILLTNDGLLNLFLTENGPRDSESGFRTPPGNKILELNISDAIVQDIPIDAEDSISLDQIGTYYLQCLNPGIKHYFNNLSIRNYCERDAVKCIRCPMCRDYDIEPKIYRRSI